MIFYYGYLLFINSVRKSKSKYVGCQIIDLRLLKFIKKMVADIEFSF